MSTYNEANIECLKLPRIRQYGSSCGGCCVTDNTGDDDTVADPTTIEMCVVRFPSDAVRGDATDKRKFDHPPHEKPPAKCKKFVAMIALTFVFFVVELVGSIIIGSLALRADAFHMGSDVIALIIGLHSARVASKRTDHATYGWTRSEYIGALVNGTFLLATCFNMTIESIHRFIELDKVKETLEGEGIRLLVVALLGLGVNIVGIVMFSFGDGDGGHGHGHNHGGDPGHGGGQNENTHGVLLHIVADTLGSLAVVVTACVIEWGGDSDMRYAVDPICTLFIVSLIFVGAVKMVKRVARVLLQSAPPHIDVPKTRKHIEEISGVQGVHDFHVWQHSGDTIILTCHIKCAKQDFEPTSDAIKTYAHSLGIHNSVIQPEFDTGQTGCQEPICSGPNTEQCMKSQCC